MTNQDDASAERSGFKLRGNRIKEAKPCFTAHRHSGGPGVVAASDRARSSTGEPKESVLRTARQGDKRLPNQEVELSSQK